VCVCVCVEYYNILFYSGKHYNTRRFFYFLSRANNRYYQTLFATRLYRPLYQLHKRFSHSFSVYVYIWKKNAHNKYLYYIHTCKYDFFSQASYYAACFGFVDFSWRWMGEHQPPASLIIFLSCTLINMAAGNKCLEVKKSPESFFSFRYPFYA